MMIAVSAPLTIRAHHGPMDTRFDTVPARRRASLWPVSLLASLAIALIPLAAVFGQTADHPFLVEQTGRSFATLQEAIDAIGPGRGTIVIGNGRFAQCGVQRAGTVTFRAAERGKAVLAGVACEGKAALVLRGGGAAVDGLVFAGIRVPDRNGAGIRLENGDLAVTRTIFRDSEQGIMSVNGKSFRLSVDHSTFRRLGTCEGSGGCAHSIYMGDYGELAITASRFDSGAGGHYVKSRAARTTVSGSSFDDSAGHGTNYMIDLPGGGGGAIADNRFVQGADKENASTLIAVGAEGAKYSSDGLVIADNDAALASGATGRPAFITDWTGDRLVIRGNTLGAGIRLFASK